MDREVSEEDLERAVKEYEGRALHNPDALERIDKILERLPESVKTRYYRDKVDYYRGRFVRLCLFISVLAFHGILVL